MTASLPASPPRRPLRWTNLVDEIAQSVDRPDRLYLVGGVVRDALLGIPAHDIDLATPDNGLKVARKLANRLDGAYYPVDPERRTGRVILTTGDKAQTVIDVASLRGPDLLADLQARDFTINAMAVRLDTTDKIIDPLDGQQDLFDHRLLRQCRADSLSADPVRALRAVRQARQFNLRIERRTLSAIRQAAPLLADESGELLQPERNRDEFFKILLHPHPAGGLRLLHATGILKFVFPCDLPPDTLLSHRIAVVEKLSDLFSIISPRRSDNTASQLILGVGVMILDRYRQQLQEHLGQTYGEGRPRSTLALLGSLTPPGSMPWESWVDWFRLSKAERRMLSGLEQAAGYGLLERPAIDDRAIHRYYRASGEAGIDGVLLALAEYLASRWPTVEPESWGSLLEEMAAPMFEAIFRRHQQVITPPPLLSGTDLIEQLGLQPGLQIGQIIEQLIEEQAAGTIRTKKEALELAERLANRA